MVYWKVWPDGAGGWPICPAATWAFCWVTPATASWGVSPRVVSLSGSSHTRIE